MKRQLVSVLVLIMSMVGVVPSVHAESLAHRLSGRILLQTDGVGELWYVNPKDERRYCLSCAGVQYSPLDFGTGITNDELFKIPIALVNYSGSADSDGDGLSDFFEGLAGTDKNSADTDHDGYSDIQEIVTGHNPDNNNIGHYDSVFARKNAGKVFLQVQSHGEGWYVNPVDFKRYYLGYRASASSVIRTLSLGITSVDLNTIPINTEGSKNDNKISCHNYNCFITAINKGKLPSGTIATIGDLEGLKTESVLSLAVSKQDQSFLLETDYKSAKASATQKFKKDRLAQGQTKEDIDFAVNMTTQALQSSVNNPMVCTYPSKESLKKDLIQRRDGIVSVEGSSGLEGSYSYVKDAHTGERLGKCIYKRVAAYNVELDKARLAARDSMRIAYMKEVAQGLDIAAEDNPTNILTCIGGILNTCSTSKPTDIPWSNLTDPSKPATPCSVTSGVPCEYTIKPGSTVKNYELCFGLEGNTSVRKGKGLAHIIQGGIFASGCSF